MALELKRLGVKKKDKIAILSENRPAWVISDLAIMLRGAVVVPLHTTFNPLVIYNILKHCEAKIIIVSNRNLLNKVLLAKKKLKFLKKIIFLEKITPDLKKILGKKIITWEKLFEQSATDSPLSPLSPLSPPIINDICTIIYTSGTTGKPKGVELSHQNILSNWQAVNKAVPVKTNDIFLSFLPLSHIFERLAGYYVPLLFGATIAYAENINQLPYNLKEIKPTVLISVPRIFEKFEDAIWDKINKSGNLKKKLFLWAIKQRSKSLRHKIADFLIFRKIRKQLGGHLRLTISGGASLNRKTAKFFYRLGIKILEGYGLTETSPVVSVNRENDFWFGTVGKVLDNVQVKISPEKEILVKGPNVFQRYFRNKKETKKAFAKDGWFLTGDLGFIDKDGFLTIIGRKKEMILTSGGKNIWPEPIENLLNKDRFISQSMVIGNKRKFISALIVPDWDEVKKFLKENKLPLKEPEKLVKNLKIIELFLERLNNKINPNLSDYEKIKKFKILSHEFSQERGEMTPTLKLRRSIIEEHYKKEIEEMYQN
jgi:long-chain acyl-CoA synthetase